MIRKTFHAVALTAAIIALGFTAASGSHSAIATVTGYDGIGALIAPSWVAYVTHTNNITEGASVETAGLIRTVTRFAAYRLDTGERPYLYLLRLDQPITTTDPMALLRAPDLPAGFEPKLKESRNGKVKLRLGWHQSTYFLADIYLGEDKADGPNQGQDLWMPFYDLVFWIEGNVDELLPVSGPFGDPDDELMQLTRQFLKVRKSGDAAAVAKLLAEDSRVWFREMEGEGTPRKPGGGGPWSDWDDVFHSESTARAFSRPQLYGGLINVCVEEINDFYRLIDREPRVYQITYGFNEDNLIETTLIRNFPFRKSTPDKFGDAQAWIKEHYPGALEVLMPDGRIDPSRENAKKWITLLTEWRSAAGLAPVALGGGR